MGSGVLWNFDSNIFSRRKYFVYLCFEKAACSLHTIPLIEVKERCNLKLDVSPWILGRQTLHEYESIWSLNEAFTIEDSDSLICRNSSVLYFPAGLKILIIMSTLLR